MPAFEAGKTSLQIMAAGLLLTGSFMLFGCSSFSRVNNRMAGLAAPGQLARSAGGTYSTPDSFLSALKTPGSSKKVLAAVQETKEWTFYCSR